MELHGAVAIVTGGSRGIGRGIVAALAAEGADIVIGDVLGAPGIADAAAETVQMVEKAGRRAVTIDCDVREEAHTKALVDAALGRFGRLDIVCANAGVISTAAVAELTVEEWDRVMDVNAKGVFLTCKAAVPHFVEQRAGCFVNTASIAGKRGSPRAAHYCASKFAVIGFTQSLALEMAPFNVRANSICPGFLGTEMWLSDILKAQRERGEDTGALFERISAERVPLKRPQTPEDIGQAAVYLCKAENVTGEALIVAGGLEMA
jgi:meso-butanediol dehydrogenase/(S,S)-butanediol dehydrogenase/diacetyl reductase